ncbi:hypothetical protein OAA91_01025 [Fibrobacterales bacterium]|nr:hypothetical protein [Fibrobacterales bacterium]
MIKIILALSFFSLTLIQPLFSQSVLADSIAKNSSQPAQVPAKDLNIDTNSNQSIIDKTPKLTDSLIKLDSTFGDSIADTTLLTIDPPFKPWIQFSLNIAIAAYSSQDLDKIETASDTLFKEWKDEIQEDTSSFPRQQGFPGAHMIFPVGASLRLHYSGLSLILGREAWQAGQNNIFSTFENTKEVSWKQWATQYRVGLDWDIPYSFMHFKDSSLITVGVHYLYVDQSILKFNEQNSKLMSGQGYELQVSSDLFRLGRTSIRVELFWNSTQLKATSGEKNLIFPETDESLNWENSLFGGRFQFLVGI